ncbi:MAG: SAM-dependent methyltransferase [Tannerellaceae bacterium]|nr:SAM-dependent methyltransferase [Tannerellaceae bacterium]
MTTNRLNITTKQFIQEHSDDDLNRLLLGASRYPDIDVPFAVDQIAARRQIRDKLPSWYKNDDLVFPSKIATEQCSSEQTAFYKQRLINEATCLCDLTGGLGIDSYFFSLKAKKVLYIERFESYCETAIHNFRILGARNIDVVQGDATILPENLPDIDVFYIDPARRASGDKRVFALHDCEPDLINLLPGLLQHAPKVIAKLSPMADIRQTLELLPGTTEVHVVSVKNDCKELLFIIEPALSGSAPLITCVNYTTGGTERRFVFNLQQEKQTEIAYTAKIDSYLYEPNVSVLKAGAFKVITALGVNKLHPSSHLYTSELLIESFPGRVFRVEEIFPFSSKLCKTLAQNIPQANITARNFPLTVEALRSKTKIKEGGNIYLFATTTADGGKTLVKCRKAFPAG